MQIASRIKIMDSEKEASCVLSATNQDIVRPNMLCKIIHNDSSSIDELPKSGNSEVYI
jgi:hypothetical protein